MIRKSPPFWLARLRLTGLALALALAVFGTLGAPAPAGAQSCLSAGQMRSAISSGQIGPLSTIRAAVRSRGYTELGSASVCQSGGRLVYTVVASSASGASARITLDARSGAILQVR